MRIIGSVPVFLVAFAVWAQPYPTRPVKVVIPFPPGGAPDLIGRTLAARLGERLGQPFVVENRTGAGGNIVAEAVAKSPPDGYTLFAPSDGPLVINPNVYANVPFDTLRDFAPISLTASVGLVLMACRELPVSTVRELVALSKHRRLSFASSGFGSSQHLAGEMLKSSAGIQLTHVPYKGFGQAVVDAVACNVDLIFGAISTGLPHIRAGKLKPLAVTTPRRHPGLPDTPTFPEAGHPSVTMEAYFGLLAPAGTPRAIIERLHAEVAAILKEKETVERLRGAGLDVAGNSPEEFTARLKADLEKFAKVAKSLGTKAE
ncbi:MAG: tripartite tricarboxylate transporter substrate binding protein [Betaproteobacteria bacterium]|nr:MAG: tripartite tricarboxylate transporter substrate binding protein [Betaproteobacteria bacterium]